MCMDFRRGEAGQHLLGLNWSLGRGKTRQRKAEQAEPWKAKGKKHQRACFFPCLATVGSTQGNSELRSVRGS